MRLVSENIHDIVVFKDKRNNLPQITFIYKDVDFLQCST